MYTSYYFEWAQPCYIPAFPCLFYSNPYSFLTPSQLSAPQTEISSLNHENTVKMLEDDWNPILHQGCDSGSKRSRFKYPKKNVESNVINQVISYLTTKAKSQIVLRKILASEEKVQAFYEILKLAKKKNRKYMGRSVLQNLLEIDEDHPVNILHKKLKSRITLKLTEIRKALIRLANYFLKNLIVPTLLTSSKLDKATIHQHLLRAREILAFVNSKPHSAM